jgi:hypothetical protein
MLNFVLLRGIPHPNIILCYSAPFCFMWLSRIQQEGCPLPGGSLFLKEFLGKIPFSFLKLINCIEPWYPTPPLLGRIFYSLSTAPLS